MTMASKTRERLLDVARQLFASNGVEKTTMNDIATASDKGRRTIYTYFKNKKEIYDAVIERESEAIVLKLRAVVTSNLAPAEKLKRFLEARFDIVEETIHESTTSQLLSYITLDYKRLERIRTLAVAKEQGLISRMIDEGVQAGVFDPVQAKLLPGVYQMIFQGFDFCHLRNNFSQFNMTASEIRSSVINFLINTIIVKPTI
ncbi:TetR/AcrR family transcriptional regulator [uncultured Duncaniella sp.]|uniref:TetR/AcrR family transcriptional regulator n=4 Tax=uncultured Duncaniella sp. TaxID=2768039 RepID=UPI0026382987|nr:TetR/AcrR family transcriptional regulator [uncultured Duncaniella sp.]